MPTFSVVPAACAVPIPASITAAANTVRFISVALPLSRIDWILFLLSALDTGEAAAATPHARRSVGPGAGRSRAPSGMRSEEHTPELQSLMRISYAVFCLKKKKQL